MNSCLPFPRGSTMSDLGRSGITPTAAMWSQILGQKYEVQDDLHSTGLPVILLVVRLETAFTTSADYFGLLYPFDADSKDFGRELQSAAASNSAGALAVPLDDHYSKSQALLANDLVYVILSGPGYGATAASGCNLTAHDPITSGSTGRLQATIATAAQTVLGTIDGSTAAEDANVLVFWDIDLKKEVSN